MSGVKLFREKCLGGFHGEGGNFQRAVHCPEENYLGVIVQE